MAMDMMKKNLSMIIPQRLTFAWVNFFFSGFVVAKIPFPLTQRFRAILQNGIDLSTVDVSYVSSRSWYFLNLFELRGLFSLILGEDNGSIAVMVYSLVSKRRITLFCLIIFSHVFEVLVGTRSITTTIIRIKSQEVNAFGFYVHPFDVCERLRPKFACIPENELKRRQDFY